MIGFSLTCSAHEEYASPAPEDVPYNTLLADYTSL